MSFFFSCSCFPLEINLQSKGKTFQVGVAEYRSNLEGCKWLHCEALKASKEEESRKVRGSWRLMTPVHWWFEVIKRREEEGWRSILQEVEQTFHLLKVQSEMWDSYSCSKIRVFTQTETNRDRFQETLGEEVELLWPSVPLCCARQYVFYFVSISLHKIYLQSHIQTPIQSAAYGVTDLTPMAEILNSRKIYLEDWHKTCGDFW